MNLTVQQLLTESLGLIGAVAVDETPTTSELNNAMLVANVMLGRWSSQNLMIRSDLKITFPLVGNKADYTIGLVGADLTYDKPLSLNHGYITDNGSDYNLDVITERLYDEQDDKKIAFSRPQYVCYDPGSAQQTNQTGTFTFYDTPDTAYTATLSVSAYLTEFVNLSDIVTFEKAYYEAIIYNLAVRLFRRYHSVTAVIPTDITTIATYAENNIKNMNSQPINVGTDLPGVKPLTYNILTDQ
jgi:hypothetical protein